MKFFALSLMALGASAAPQLTQVHHTVGLGYAQHGLGLGHKQVIATPVTYNKVVQPIGQQVVQSLPTVVKAVDPVVSFNKVQTFAIPQPASFVHPTTYVQPTYVQPTYVQPTTYVQPSTFVKPVQPVQYVHRPVQTLVTPTVQATHYRNQEVNLPVHQVDRSVEYLDVPHVEKPAEIQTFRIAPSANTLHLHFDTQSSQLTTSQSHVPAPAAEPKFQESQDETSFLKANIVKPVVQHVTETVHPHREITHEILPLKENIRTVVPKAQHERVPAVVPYTNEVSVQPIHHQTIVKPIESTFVNTLNVPQATYLKTVEVQPSIVKQSLVAPSFMKPIEIVQDHTFAFAKPIKQIIHPTAHITTGITKEVLVDKIPETITY